MNRIGYSINAHENGWAVFSGGVIQGIYPSKHLAKISIQGRIEKAMPTATTQDQRLGKSRDISTSVRQGDHLHVSVPHNVLPLMDAANAVNLPVDISGRDLSSGKL